MGQPFDIASEVTAAEGQVQVDGPGGFALSFTPQAALTTAERLAAASAEAAAQLDRMAADT